MPVRTAFRPCRNLPDDPHLPRPQIHDCHTGRMLHRPRGAPIGIRRRLLDPAVSDDGDYRFVLSDDGFVRDPLVWGFRIEGPQSRAVGLDEPCPLRRLAAGFPAEDDFARNPRIGLHVPDTEPDIDEGLDFPGLEIHAPQTAGSLPESRAERRLHYLALGQLRDRKSTRLNSSHLV